MTARGSFIISVERGRRRAAVRPARASGHSGRLNVDDIGWRLGLFEPSALIGARGLPSRLNVDDIGWRLGLFEPSALIGAPGFPSRLNVDDIGWRLGLF